MDGRSRPSNLLRLAFAVSFIAFLGIAGGCGGGNEGSQPAQTETPAATAEDGGGGTTTSAETEDEAAAAGSLSTVGIVAPEKANDYNWNQQGVEGARAAAEAVGAELLVADGAGYENIAPVLQQLADDGAELVIAHASGYNTATPEFAAQSQVPSLFPDNPDALAPGLAASYDFKSEEGAYLAGVLAARMTQTNTLGLAVSADNPNWNKQSGAFIAGARSINPNVRFIRAQIGDAAYADAPGGKRVTESLIGGGADVVFGMGDGASFGMIQAVETATPPDGADRVWFIDDIGDKSSIDEKGVLLSSILWDFQPTFEAAMRDVAAGTFGEQNYILDLSNGGIDLLQTEAIPDDVWAEIEEARQAIIDGTIEVPATATIDEVNGLLEG